MVKAAYSEGFQRFFLNLTGDVGPKGRNLLEDVELVRFGIFCLTKAPPKPGADPRLQAAFLTAAKAVKFVGGFDATISTAIEAYQRMSGRIVDGTVSVIRGDDTPHGDTYVLQTMLANMAAEYPNLYPRVDRVVETGPTITQRLRHLFVGSY